MADIFYGQAHFIVDGIYESGEKKTNLLNTILHFFSFITMQSIN